MVMLMMVLMMVGCSVQEHRGQKRESPKQEKKRSHQECKNTPMLAVTGICSRCGDQTAYSVHKYCAKCARTLGVCESCGE